MIENNQSHNTNLYKSNTIVVHRPTGEPAFVESRDNSNEAPDEWRYSIVTLGAKAPFYVPEADLRPMTWKEYQCFRHPKEGVLMAGKTRLWMKVVIFSISGLGIGASLADVVQGNLASLIPLVIAAAVPALFQWQTHRNFTGKTV